MTIKTILARVFIVVILVTLLTSCLKKPNHSIRIQNFYSQAWSDIKINSTSYGRVEIGGVTGYKPVEEGNFIVTGTTENGNPLLGKGYITGKGDFDWTLTINEEGKLSFSVNTLKK
jgi:hypothetical protein